MCADRISESRVSRRCAGIDVRAHTFVHRRMEGNWRCFWLDATNERAHREGHAITIAVIVEVSVHTDGSGKGFGMTGGHGETEPSRAEFLRSLTRRGLRGVKPVALGAHERSKAGITKMPGATRQSCRIRFICNTPAYEGTSPRRILVSSGWAGLAQDAGETAASTA